jgi:hypothetical protein
MVVKVEFVPTLRMRWVEPNGRDFGDNLAFRDWYLSRSHREQLRIMKRPNGTLTARECFRLWRYLGRTDPVPKALTIYLNKPDLLKMLDDDPKVT